MFQSDIIKQFLKKNKLDICIVRNKLNKKKPNYNFYLA